MILPFLTIPIVLPGDEGQGNSDKSVDCKIQPISILAYHEGYSWGTFIYLQTGQAFCSSLTMEQLENALRAYWNEVNQPKKQLQTIKPVGGV